MPDSMPHELWWSPSMRRFLTRYENQDDEHLVWVFHGHSEALRHYLGTGLESNPPLPDDAVRLVPAPSEQTYEWGFRLADGDAVVPALSEEAARAATGPDPESTRLWPEGPPKVVAVRRPVGPWVSVGEAKTDG